MSKRVKSVVVEDCELVVTYSDCTEDRYDLRDCGDDTPPSKDPGEWPPPDPVEDVRCRVAIHVGDDVVDRFMDFLNNLNLVNPTANVPAYTYAINRISVYGWPIGVHGQLVDFYYELGIGSTFVGNTAKGYYDNNTALALATVQEALYCVLPETGDITEAVRLAFVASLIATGGDFYTLLADFVTLWPLSDLRYFASLASTTTDAVDCSDFDCETSAASWCYTWDFTAAAGNWEPEGAAPGLSGGPQAEYFTGEGWGRPDPVVAGFSGRGVALVLAAAFADLTGLTRISYTVDPAAVGSGYNARYKVYDALDDDPTTNEALVAPVGATVINYNISPFNTYSRFAFAYYIPFGFGTYDGHIKSVTLQGTGTMPEFTGGEECEPS